MSFHIRWSTVRQHGLTLIELMVALVLGLVLLGGVLTVFIANKQTYRFQDALARLQENGRFAMTMMARDMRGAGYKGCGADTTVIANTLNDQTSYRWTFAEPVHGIDNWVSGSSPTGFKPFSGDPDPLAGTDVVTAWVGEGQGAKIIQHNLPSADLKVLRKADIHDGDVVMAVDAACLEGAIFQITNTNDDNNPGNDNKLKSNVVHNQGNTRIPGNSTKDLKKSFKDGDLLRISRVSWYVANTGRQDPAGANVPALYRTDNSGRAQEMVEGVENMQILYGLDTNNDRAVDLYQNASQIEAAGTWANVRTVRVSLMLHSWDPAALNISRDMTTSSDAADFYGWNQQYTDKRFRHVYTLTASVRNTLP